MHPAHRGQKISGHGDEQRIPAQVRRTDLIGLRINVRHIGRRSTRDDGRGRIRSDGNLRAGRGQRQGWRV